MLSHHQLTNQIYSKCYEYDYYICTVFNSAIPVFEDATRRGTSGKVSSNILSFIFIY